MTITAEVDGEIATCALEINGEPPVKPEEEPVNDPPVSPSGNDSGGSTTPADLSLNKTDFTIRPEDTPTVQLKVNGTSSKVAWASKDTNVVPVSDSGLVTKVGAGTTTVTATVDGQTLECTARVR